MQLNVDQRKTEMRGLGFAKGSLLLVHDASHNARSWYDFMKRFTNLGFDCYAIDLRGHGKSDGYRQLNDFSLSDYTDDVLSVLKQFKTPPVLIGHGMGGLISQMIYRSHPELIEGMVLMASFSQLTSGEMFKMITTHYQKTQRMMKVLTRSNQSDNFIHSSFVNNHFSKLDEKIYPNLPQMESKTALKNIMQFRTDPEMKISTPVMVIGSKSDLIVTMKQLNRLADIYHTKAYFMNDLCHDMLLDPKRKSMENEINRWINRNIITKEGA